MCKLIHVTGQSGCGKSTLAKKFESHALRVEVDPIQFEAARRAFPFAKGDLMNWYLWPEKPWETLRLNSLIGLSLRTVYPALFKAENQSKSVVIEGCFLARDWFQETLEQVLENAGYSFSSVSYLHLTQPPEIVLQRIRDRAKKNNNDAQLKIFTDVNATLYNARWFSAFLSEVWTTFDDPNLLESEINKILSVAATE